MEIQDDEVELIQLRVADKLGWRDLRYGSNSILLGLPSGKKRPCSVPPYARDIKAAWEIVECLTALQIRVSIVNEALRGYVRNFFVEIGPKDAVLSKASHRSPSVAICLAFLGMPIVKERRPFDRAVILESGDYLQKVFD